MHHDRHADMSAVPQLLLPCRSCELEIRAGATASYVRPAVWAVILKDCCRGYRRQSHLVCQEHFLELVSQKFPARCVSCGTVSRSLADVVDTAMTLCGQPPATDRCPPGIDS